MAPHPMYSVGYREYYGISMMMASYTVLFVSLAAHAAQFAFLVFVENPRMFLVYLKEFEIGCFVCKENFGKAVRLCQIDYTCIYIYSISDYI